MEEPVFADKAHQPNDADLTAVLGRTKRHWDNLLAHMEEANARATMEWKFYIPKYGWTFVMRDKRRNLCYLKPLAKHFLVSFALGKKAVDAAEQSDLPADVVKSIRESPKYPEGRVARIEVRTAPDVAIVRKLLAIKTAN